MISGGRYGVTLRGVLGHIHTFQWGSMWGYPHNAKIRPQCKLILIRTPTMYLLQTHTHAPPPPPPPHTHTQNGTVKLVFSGNRSPVIIIIAKTLKHAFGMNKVMCSKIHSQITFSFCCKYNKTRASPNQPIKWTLLSFILQTKEYKWCHTTLYLNRKLFQAIPLGYNIKG